MSMVLPEVSLQRVLQVGIKNLRNNPDAFDNIFSIYKCPEMAQNYGDAYIDGIRQWFNTTKLPVSQAFAFKADVFPQISIHLAVENEDESKASMDDYFGMSEDENIYVGVDAVSLDIGIHADKSKDHVLWLHYIVKYILYKEKYLARKLGLQLQTFSATDYNKDNARMAENVWVRTIRYRCTVQNYIGNDTLEEIDSIEIDLLAGRTTDPEDITDI